MHRIFIATLTLALAAVLAGCAQTPAVKPEVDTGALTFDGLAQVKNPAAGIAWMRPDFNLAGYTKVMLRGAGIEYRPIPRSAANKQLSVDRQAEIAPASDRWRCVQGRTCEVDEVSTGRANPGPDVLTVWGGLIDVVSYVPPEKMGNSDIYLRSVGEATLVLELRDSQSNAPLVRVIDRRAAGGSPVRCRSRTR